MKISIRDRAVNVAMRMHMENIEPMTHVKQHEYIVGAIAYSEESIARGIHVEVYEIIRDHMVTMSREVKYFA